MDIPDGDHVLTEGAGWFSIKKFAVRIYSTDEGIVVDVCADGHEMDGTLASCYAFDTEVDNLVAQTE